MKKYFLTAVTVLGTSIGAFADDIGKEAFQQYCATCHGIEANGDGPLTELMTQKVPDLTTLAQRNEGEFPMLQVIHSIDGRTGLRGHGGPMPVYGQVFRAEASGHDTYGSAIEARGRVLSIAYYLETLQK